MSTKSDAPTPSLEQIRIEAVKFSIALNQTSGRFLSAEDLVLNAATIEEYILTGDSEENE